MEFRVISLLLPFFFFLAVSSPKLFYYNFLPPFPLKNLKNNNHHNKSWGTPGDLMEGYLEAQEKKREWEKFQQMMSWRAAYHPENDDHRWTWTSASWCNSASDLVTLDYQNEKTEHHNDGSRNTATQLLVIIPSRLEWKKYNKMILILHRIRDTWIVKDAAHERKP